MEFGMHEIPPQNEPVNQPNDRPEPAAYEAFGSTGPEPTSLPIGTTSALEHRLSMPDAPDSTEFPGADAANEPPHAVEGTEGQEISEVTEVTETLEELPDDPGRIVYVFLEDNGTELLDKGEADHVAAVIRHLRDRVAYDDEVNPNDDDRAALAQVKENVAVYGERLGFDLAARIPEDRDVHIFPDKETCRQATGERIGVHGHSDGIALSRRPVDDGTGRHVIPAGIALHEYMHELGAMGVTELPEGKWKISLVWDLMMPGTDGFKEWMADLATLRAQEATGIQNAELAYPTDKFIIHHLGRAVVERMVERTGRTGPEVEDMILRGYFDGRQTGAAIAAIQSALGPEAAEAVLAMPGGDMTMQQARAIADAMESPVAHALLDKKAHDEPIDLGWRAG